jgi:8-oxo-dGTP pyrophosphatase MutT (NUDIX family)
MSEARTILLRRPPVIVRADGRFVPSSVPLDEVDARWEALCAANPRYFDGGIVQVLGTSRNGHGGVQIHVQECSYRFYAVQNPRPGEPGLDCGVRPLGVKGIAVARESDGSLRVLVGRRSSKVAFYPSAWEFVPAGGLEPGVEPSAQVVRELREETGLVSLAAPTAVALLFDPGAFSWEVVHRLEVAGPSLGGHAPEVGWEYDEFAFVTPDALPEPLAPVARQMLPLAASLIRAAASR